MSRKFLTNVDLNKNELQNARMHNLASAPASPVPGQKYYNTTTNVEYTWNGSAWIACDAASRSGIPLANLAQDPLARGNHTGTQPAATIADLAATVKAYRHDEFAAPTAAIPMAGQKLTGLGAPTPGSNDSARIVDVENAVQSAAAGIDTKPSCRVVAVANVTLSAPQTIDGVSAIAGDRVLCVGQTTASQNGVYVVAAGAWVRATDADVTGEITPGAFWFVEEGTAYGKSQWRCNNTGAITLGTTSITIVQFGASADLVAGNGIQPTGNTWAVKPNTGILVTAAGVAVDTAVVVRKYAATIGDGVATSITITHNLNNQDVMVQLREVATNNIVECDMQNNSANTTVLAFAAAPASNALRVVVQG